MKQLLFVIGLILGLFAATVFIGSTVNAATPPTTVAQGGTGSTSVALGQILFGQGGSLPGSLRLGGASALTYGTSTQRLSFTFGSSTSISLASLCLTSDVCRTSWPTSSGGAFPFAADTNYGQVVYSTSTPTLWFKSGVFASSTSHFFDFDFRSATGTALAITGSTTINTLNLTNGLSNAMLANSTISGIALGGTLGALTATDATLTFSGSYTGNVARTVGLNLSNANTWIAIQTFGGLSATNATSTGTLTIPQGASPILAGIGDIAVDTSPVPQFLVSTTTTDTNPIVFPATVPLPASYASTTWTGTTTLQYGGGAIHPFTVFSAYCYSNTGTAFARIGDGTNWSNIIAITSSQASTSLTTNNVFAYGAKVQVQFGTPASSVVSVGCTFDRRYTRL